MASSEDFAQYIVEQLQGVGEISIRRMFGEYCLYVDGKVLGLICDDKLFVKPTKAGKSFIGDDLVEAPAFPGAKPSFLIEEQLEQREWLRELVRVSYDELKFPKPKKKKK